MCKEDQAFLLSLELASKLRPLLDNKGKSTTHIYVRGKG